MARPLKQGLDYFPLDVDFFQDKKIRRVKSEYGADGITIYLYLLCEIYRNGYYITADNDFIYSMADDLKMSVNKINQVLTFLLGRSLFDNKLFRSDTILTSASVQRRYLFAAKERIKENNVEVKDFWLLEKTVAETLGQVRHFSENPQENPLKESKENKTKLYKTISKCAGTLHAHERELLEKEFGKAVVSDYIERTSKYKCCNYATIRQWILEDREKKHRSSNQFNNFNQRDCTDKEIDSLEQALLKKQGGQAKHD